MKKLLALLLAVVMVCSLVACGTSDTEEPSSSASTGNDAADAAEDAVKKSHPAILFLAVLFLLIGLAAVCLYPRKR